MPELITYKKLIDKADILGMHDTTIIEALNLLYKDGFITYPRTNDEYLPFSFFENRKIDLENLIASNYNDLDFISKYASKINLNLQSSLFSNSNEFNHHAIIPTCIDKNFDSHNKRFNINYSYNTTTGFIFDDRGDNYIKIYKYIRDNYIELFVND
jgi:DNA topoisomerase IA